MIIGYARVSTDQQELDGQQASLREAGAERIFSEKVSGAVTDRKALGEGDSCAWPWGYSVGHSPRSARSLNQGPTQHSGHGV